MRAAVHERFWHSQGGGNPWAGEHFGMTTVEAMAGGCVPVVIDRAGQEEIVRDGLDGHRWSTPEALDEDEFAARWRDIADRHHLR